MNLKMEDRFSETENSPERKYPKNQMCSEGKRKRKFI
jgi:hypothetical protein